MNKKIILFAMIIAGMLLNSRFTNAKGVNCEDPKLASDECIVDFGDFVVKRGVIVAMAEHGIIAEEFGENPDPDMEITVGQMRRIPERTHLNLIIDDYINPIRRALDGDRVSLKGLEYLNNLAGFYSLFHPIYDFSALSNTELKLTDGHWYNKSLVVFKDVKLNKNGVFKNPIIGTDGRPLPFGEFPEENLKKLAQKGRVPILVQDVNENGEPDRNGGYLKLLNDPYIMDYETATEDAGNDYASLWDYQYESGIILIGVSIASEEPQSVDSEKSDRPKSENIKAPNTGLQNQGGAVRYMLVASLLMVVTYITIKK